MSNDACGILLCLEHPLGADDVHSWWWLLEYLSPYSFQGGQLLKDGFLPPVPVRTMLGLGEHARLQCLSICSLSEEDVLEAFKILEELWGAVNYNPHSPCLFALFTLFGYWIWLL